MEESATVVLGGGLSLAGVVHAYKTMQVLGKTAKDA